MIRFSDMNVFWTLYNTDYPVLQINTMISCKIYKDVTRLSIVQQLSHSFLISNGVYTDCFILSMKSY